MAKIGKPRSFQEVILRLQTYWASKGCAILQPYDMEVGAGTFHPATTLRSLGAKPWAAAYVQPSRRPTDGRYGENPNRMQHYYQYQVLIKPSPPDLQTLYLGSLEAIGIDMDLHDIRFVEDDWESPTLGAWGLGWEVWCDGMEVSQFTYFQQVGGHDCAPVSGELTYGLERLAMYVLGVDHVMDMPFNDPDAPIALTYGDIFRQTEEEYSRWNFDVANTEILLKWFEEAEAECTRILAQPFEDPKTGKRIVMAHPAYDQCIKASHLFNLLDARGVISVTERQAYIGRVRALAKQCADAFVQTDAAGYVRVGMKGKWLMGGLLIFTAVFASALWYFQNYAYYEVTTPDDFTVEMTLVGGDDARAPIPAHGFTVLDSETSPLKFRACFTVENSIPRLTETFVIVDNPTPLTPPSFFDCFDVRQLTEDLSSGKAIAFLGQKNISHGVDRVIAVYDDGRAFAWHQTNDLLQGLIMADLLLELFSEEIPARMQTRAAEDLKRLVTDGLVERGITYEAAAAFSTPRRLVLSLTGLPAKSPTLKEERKGPRTDAPAQALEGFLRSTGLTKDQLEARADKKGDVWFAVIEKPGRAAAEVVAEVVEATVRNFPWPKAMRWGAGSLRWVRPLHAILCILHDEAGAHVVPGEIDGIAFGDTTAGHRFMAPGHFAVTSFEDYSAKLTRAFVVLDAADRAAHIEADAQNMAFAQGLEIVEDKGLLAEIAGLVEWPVVLMGPIGEDFLGLPPEVLQTSMKEHQKFLSVRNPKTGRIEKFVTVANRTTADDGSTILAGNLKVLSARLSDARFFWENDLRTVKREGLGAMAAPLAGVTFHNLLGSQAERIARIAALARDLAPSVGADAALARQAAEVAKADLASEMVYEFPELQGVMGKYYARAAGLDDAVAEACAEHYSPLGPSDAVPTAPVSVAVALADKLDLLTGFWAIDEKPTGSKDPFALRRAALGVIRLVVQNGIRLHLDRFIDAGLLRHQITPVNGAQEEALLHSLLSEVAHHGVFGAAVHAAIERIDGDAPAWVQKLVQHEPDKSDDLLSFIHDRLKVHLRDQGIRHDVIDACLAMPNKDDLALLVRRAEALSAFLASDDGVNLVQGFKRANNILTQAEAKDGVHYELDPDVKFAEDDAERALFAALDAAEAAIAPAMEAEDFAAAMSAMAGLRAPIDAFFEAVQINTDNQIVRRNRLCLLNRIRAVMAAVARFESLEG